MIREWILDQKIRNRISGYFQGCGGISRQEIWMNWTQQSDLKCQQSSSGSAVLDSLAFGKVTQDSRTKITTCFSVLQGVSSAELVCQAATTLQRKVRLCKDNEFPFRDGQFFVRSKGWNNCCLIQPQIQVGWVGFKSFSFPWNPAAIKEEICEQRGHGLQLEADHT